MRIIAKLDVKPPYVVKPVHFEGWCCCSVTYQQLESSLNARMRCDIAENTRTCNTYKVTAFKIIASRGAMSRISK